VQLFKQAINAVTTRQLTVGQSAEQFIKGYGQWLTP